VGKGREEEREGQARAKVAQKTFGSLALNRGKERTLIHTIRAEDGRNFNFKK
jgi:hypothetical protein